MVNKSNNKEIKMDLSKIQGMGGKTLRPKLTKREEIKQLKQEIKELGERYGWFSRKSSWILKILFKRLDALQAKLPANNGVH